MSLKEIMDSIDAEACGLKVLTQDDISAVQSVLLKSLADLDTYCQNNNIIWSLAGGSMLGAIRHQGFIPWDDDVDIHMERREFDKFRKAMTDNPMNGYELKCPGDDNYLFHFPKLYIKGTRFLEFQSDNDAPDELFIDIYILENCPDNTLARKLHGWHCMYYMAACSAMRVRSCRENMIKYSSASKDASAAVRKRIRTSALWSWRSLQMWCLKAVKVFSNKKKDNTSEYIVIPGGARHYFGEMYKRDWICNVKRVKFENLMLPVPKESEKMLEQRYGANYMEIPSPANRAKHAIIDYKLP